MDLFEAIRGRRSVRAFTESEPPGDYVEKILEAGRWAPSWANSQCVRYVVVRDAERIRRLRETMPEKNPARPAFDSAAFVLAVVAKHGLAGYKRGEPVADRAWHMFDAALAVQNVSLAAHSLGLGSVIVGLFDWRAADEVLGVPEGYETVCLVPFGYPKGEPPTPPRKPLSELLSQETFKPDAQ